VKSLKREESARSWVEGEHCQEEEEVAAEERGRCTCLGTVMRRFSLRSSEVRAGSIQIEGAKTVRAFLEMLRLRRPRIFSSSFGISAIALLERSNSASWTISGRVEGNVMNLF
jgi:hypothetical protein